MISSAQISVYPLRQEHLGPAIDMVRQRSRRTGFARRSRSDDTMVTGDAAIVFAARADAFDKAAQAGQVVMTFTVSNACPVLHQPPGPAACSSPHRPSFPPASSAPTSTRPGGHRRWERSSRVSSVGFCCASPAICKAAPSWTWDG